MKDYIKLVRLPNLVFLVLLYILLYFFVLEPVLGVFEISPSMSVLDLVLLMASTVFIAAGGYVINDYFDMRIDEINRPLTRVVGKSMPRSKAMVFYEVLTCIGMAFALTLCFRARSLLFVFMFIMVVGLLWFYSSSYKRMYVLGNLSIAFLAAMVPVFMGLFEIKFEVNNMDLSEEQFEIGRSLMINWMGGFGICAFMWTFLREMVKDMEDVNGDRELECHTFAVVHGIEKTKILFYLFLLVTLVVCGYLALMVSDQFDGSSLIWRCYAVGIVLPSFFIVYLMHKSMAKADFRAVSHMLKIVMSFGMLFSLIIYYEISML